jgi:uncharacterized protein YbjT (DUF2867 family)
LPESGYIRAKVAQEDLIRHAEVPYTIVKSTQFTESLARLAHMELGHDVVRVPNAGVQPIAAIDAARLLATIAAGQPANGALEIAGPEVFSFEDAVARVLAASDDGRRAVADPDAGYFGAIVRDGVLLPGPEARIATTELANWLTRQRNEVAAA